MPRIRTIKPEFFRDETLQDIQTQYPELNPMLVFAGLWTVCDKEGRFEWRPRVLHLDILPFLDFDFDASLLLLERFSMIHRYEIEGKPYGLVRTFTRHQRISGKEAQDPPKFPEPVCFLPVTDPTSRGSDGEAVGKHQGSQEREREKEREKERILSNPPDSTLFDVTKPTKGALRIQAVEEAFDLYLTTFQRDGRLYKLTPPRRNIGTKRLEWLEPLCDGDIAAAKEFLAARIRAIAESKWHMGANPDGKKYIDWTDHVMNASKFEKWFHEEVDKARGGAR